MLRRGEGASDSLPIPDCRGVQYVNRHNGPQDYFSDIVHHSHTVLLPVLPRQGSPQQQSQRCYPQQPRECEVSADVVRAVLTSDLGEPWFGSGTIPVTQDTIQFVE